ncbi:putative type VI secretion system effector [Xanthomonas oryzae pv. oryzicola]|uniref:putative type VI secretion system effector n=2 Tax=Xanthomonas oryzae TaxID=347 RepID=UPI003DA062AC
MIETSNVYARVISGKLINVRVENTTAEVFFRDNDRDGMAATGAVAAALGLSGAAAGMVASSMDEMKEPVCKVNFDLNKMHVEALLWSWPFSEGDEVQAVVEPALGGGYTAFAVLDPKDKIIALYPHVSAGSHAHWKNVLKIASLFGVAFSVFMMALVFISTRTESFSHLRISPQLYFMIFVMFLSMSLWIGYRLGRRFTPFIEMAEPIFSLLEWDNVKNINLRKITKAKKKPTDPPAMGDSYFRY